MANVQRAAKLVQRNRRGGCLLLYGGNLYAKNRIRNDKIYWRCNVPSCGVFLQTGWCPMQIDSEVMVTRQPSRHDHATYGDDYQEKVQLLVQMTSAVQVSLLKSNDFLVPAVRHK